MKLSKHCDLCEHEKKSLEIGVTCGLTDRKPEFNNTCSKINLNNKFLEKLEIINLDLKEIRGTKNSVKSSFYFFIIIGFLLIIIGYSLVKWTLLSAFILETKISTILIGISFLIAAFTKLINFRRKLKNAEFDKNEIDDLLKKYGIHYKADINFKEKNSWNTRGNRKVGIQQLDKKSTSRTYEIKPSL